MAVTFGILGPFQVLVDGGDVTLSAPKERALLGMLVTNRGRVVSADRIIEELWPKLGADRARRVLHVRVAAVRRLLKDATGASRLQFVRPGYRLDVAPDEIDEEHFVSLVARARGELLGDRPGAALATFRQALAMWRGDPLADVQLCVSLEAEAARLAETRVDAIEDCIDAELACGLHQTVMPELDALVATHPLRERLWAQRVLALYRCGRQAEALRACSSIRRRLADELGVEPGPALRHLEAAVLEQRPELDDPRGTDPSRAGRAPAGLRSAHEIDTMPPVMYARTTDGLNLGYRLVGEGPVDLIVVQGFLSHLDMWWDSHASRLVRQLASSMRLVLFDKRGMGLSDRPPRADIDDWMEDTRVVLDAVGSERAVVLGMSAGGSIAALFAATYPERVHALVIYGSFARLHPDVDYPIGKSRDEWESNLERMQREWGSGVGFDVSCQSRRDDPVARQQYGWFQRISASPGGAAAYLRTLADTDVRQVLPMINAPTLVLHATGDRSVPIELGRYMAEHIPNAKMVELDSNDHMLWFHDALDELANEVRDFALGATPSPEINRVLTTVLFVDGADDITGQVVDRFRGRVVSQDRHGVLAAFDGPARAIRCASAIVNGTDDRLRAGVHSGECEVTGNDVGGVPVRIARRLASVAQIREVLVSQTVRDLVLGSAITFCERGTHVVDGVTGEWRLFGVTGI